MSKRTLNQCKVVKDVNPVINPAFSLINCGPLYDHFSYLSMSIDESTLLIASWVIRAI